MYQYIKSFVVISILMLTMGCIDKKASQLKDGDVVMANTSNVIEVTLFDDVRDLSNELMIKQLNASDNINYIQSVTRLAHPNAYYLGRYIIQTTSNMPPARYEVSRKPFSLWFGAYPIPITGPTIQFKAEKEGLQITHNNKHYSTVISHNKVWLDRNLGATSTSCSADSSSCQGDFYAWQPEFASTQGAVCPIGFRVPTINELERLFSTIQDRDDALKHKLVIPTVGSKLHTRHSPGYARVLLPDNNNHIIGMNKNSLLWSSTHNNQGHGYIYFSETMYGSEYNTGHARFQVRCIKH